MIHINKFVTVQQAGREALKRQLKVINVQNVVAKH